MINKTKTLGVALIGSMMATTAFTQMKIDGHQELNLITGSSKGPGNELEKTVGKETTLRFSWDLGKLPNGMPLSTSFRLYGERGVIGVANVEGASANADVGMVGDEYIINVGVTPDLTVYAGGEIPKGIETVRTIQPNVTNRPRDIIGSTGFTGLIDAADNTSGKNYVGADLKTGMGGILSVAITPNARQATGQITDGIASDANRVGMTASQYSVGYRFDPVKGLRVGVGALKSRQHGNIDENESRTAGVSYTVPGTALAVGYQYTYNTDGTTATTSVEREQNTISGVFGVTKELNVGVSYTKTQRINENVKATVETKAKVAGASYTLGALQLQYTYIDLENAAHTSGRDYQAHVFKTKVNF